MKYDFHIHHVPGKNLNTVDTLSCAPTSSLTLDDKYLQDEASAFVTVMTNTLPATDQHLAEIQACQTQGEICFSITNFCANSWSEKHQLPASSSHIGLIVQNSTSITKANCSVDSES